jgi:hypothetical protein
MASTARLDLPTRPDLLDIQGEFVGGRNGLSDIQLKPPRGCPALLPALGFRRLTHHPQERADGGVVLLRRFKVDVVTRRWDQNQP